MVRLGLLILDLCLWGRVWWCDNILREQIYIVKEVIIVVFLIETAFNTFNIL